MLGIASSRSHALFLVLAAVVATVFLVVPSFAAAAPAPTVMLSVSPTTSPIVLGLGASQLVTVTNADKAKSTSALTVALVQSAIGAGFSISQNSCSGTALGPRKSCTVTVSYRLTPGPTGVETAVLTVSSKKPDASVTKSFRTANQAPVANNDSYTTNEDTQLTIAAPVGVLANDSDVDGNPLTAVLVAGPLHGPLTLNANGSFTYTGDANYNGSDSFTYRTNDGGLNSNVATVSLTVTAVNDAPVAVNDSLTTLEDQALTIAPALLLANDSDVDGDTLRVLNFFQPAHGVLSLNGFTGVLTYTPHTGYSGADSFIYGIVDGQGGFAEATVNITVESVNDAPVANNGSESTLEDASVTITLSASDGDSLPLTAALVTNPEHGTLGPVIPTSPLSWQVLYTPDADYNGPDSFTFKVTDDGGLDSNTATVSITVIPVNDPPVAGADAITASEDTPLTIDAATLLANDVGGPPNEAAQVLTVTAVAAGPETHGTVTLNGTTITYTPQADFTGTAEFTYTLSDGEGTSTGTVTINVVPVVTPSDADVSVGVSLTPAGTQALLSVTNAGPLPVTVNLRASATFVEGSDPGPGGIGRNVPGCTTDASADPTFVVTCVGLTLAAGQSHPSPITFGASGTGQWINGVFEVTAADVPDPDSTPNNQVTSEDDYATFTVNAPAPPGGGGGGGGGGCLVIC